MSTTVLPRPRRAPRPAPTGRLRALARGHESDPAWIRPALFGVLALAAVLCLWNLTASGSSNTYYAAAVKSATESWKALFFGSIDPGSFITVDKPPLSIWLMGLSGRVLGFSSFSMLLPEALCTIAAVGVLFATVRRLFGPVAGIIAALALAITPVTIAIGRVNNPDALLVLLLVVSAWLVVKALESGRTKHLAWAGAVVGLAFMTKMLQGWMVVPALGAVYLVAGPPALATRIRQLLIAGATMVAVSAAWPVAVTLWPGSKPYIGGSTDGSVWNLIFGYNGFGRITGASEGGMGRSFGGVAGAWRMFNAEVGGQIAWLLPLAAVSLVAGLWLTRRGSRTDARRAGLILFGAWAVVLVAVFSYQQGIFHPYYVSALAPAVAALSGAGAVLLARWAKRSWYGTLAAAVAIGLTAETSVLLLSRTPDFAPWVKVAVVAAAAIAIVGLVVARMPGGLPRRAAVTVALAAALAAAAGPASYAVATASHPLDGNNVLAGPTSSGMIGGPGGGGGSLSSTTLDYLLAHQGSATYLVAVQSSHASAPIILQTGKAVVTIGGFSGQDPAPTTTQLANMVKSGQLKYVLLGTGMGGGPGGGGSSSQLTSWITQHGTEVTDAGVTAGTLYALS
ncbi:MAG: hypothetical protein QOE86_3093 [Solirubrobacteraceae bacterium]|nr:hypothetical protein [Solirubrobacteraceae bacterium]